ncbi:MAG: hypothetical protein K2X66_11820 [Cyanobacteria bacterium]|nr:hypothetical protein [Cyanobacteriota bacterium]
MSSLMSITSNLTQRILSQSNNISYGLRGWYRMGSVPEDRKADYFFRDFYMVLVTAVTTELGFRGAEKLFSFPLMTDKLQLNQLSHIYKPGSNFHKHNLIDPALTQRTIKNYGSVDEIPHLRKRLMGSLVREDSDSLIPHLLKTMDYKDKLADPSVSLETKQDIELLVYHLKRRLNFDGNHGYLSQLVKEGRITQAQSDFVTSTVKKLKDGEGLAQKLGDAIQNLTQSKNRIPESESADVLKKALEYVEKNTETLPAWFPSLKDPARQRELTASTDISNTFETLKKFITEEIPAKFKEKMNLDPVAETLIKDSIESQGILKGLQKVQTLSAWPKLLGSIALSFLVYGVVASYLDNHYIQPWQKKLVKERGTSSEVVSPFYWALIPGAATLTALMSEKLLPGLNKLGYFGKFAFAGIASLGVYTGTGLLLLKNKLNKPPANPPILFKASQSIAPQLGTQDYFRSSIVHPNGFKVFEHH